MYGRWLLPEPAMPNSIEWDKGLGSSALARRQARKPIQGMDLPHHALLCILVPTSFETAQGALGPCYKECRKIGDKNQRPITLDAAIAEPVTGPTRMSIVETPCCTPVNILWQYLVSALGPQAWKLAAPLQLLKLPFARGSLLQALLLFRHQ